MPEQARNSSCIQSAAGPQSHGATRGEGSCGWSGPRPSHGSGLLICVRVEAAASPKHRSGVRFLRDSCSHRRWGDRQYLARAAQVGERLPCWSALLAPCPLQING